MSLYRETQDERYWKLAKFLLDERGKDDYPRQGEYAAGRDPRPLSGDLLVTGRGLEQEA